MHYASGIRSARHRAGLSQAVLAKRAGRRQASISMLESGRRRSTICAVEAIARGLGVSPLAIYLLAANGRDVPRGVPGITLIGKIASLVDDLRRLRRNGSRDSRQ
jgi:transcriptional regulator with XRE-family HTH domain